MSPTSEQSPLHWGHVALKPTLEFGITQEGLPATGQATHGDDRYDFVFAALLGEVVVEQLKVPAWEGDRADMFDVLFHF